MNRTEILQTYMRYQRIWNGRSDEIITTGVAIEELSNCLNALPIGTPLTRKIEDLLEQIIEHNADPEDMEAAADE